MVTKEGPTFSCWDQYSISIILRLGVMGAGATGGHSVATAFHQPASKAWYLGKRDAFSPDAVCHSEKNVTESRCFWARATGGVSTKPCPTNIGRSSPFHFKHHHDDRINAGIRSRTRLSALPTCLLDHFACCAADLSVMRSIRNCLYRGTWVLCCSGSLLRRTVYPFRPGSTV